MTRDGVVSRDGVTWFGANVTDTEPYSDAVEQCWSHLTSVA
jgi:hypothetical protein